MTLVSTDRPADLDGPDVYCAAHDIYRPCPYCWTDVDAFNAEATRARREGLATSGDGLAVIADGVLAFLYAAAYALSWNLSLDDHHYGVHATGDPTAIRMPDATLTGATFTVEPPLAWRGGADPRPWHVDCQGWTRDRDAVRSHCSMLAYGARLGNEACAGW